MKPKQEQDAVKTKHNYERTSTLETKTETEEIHSVGK